MNISNSNLIRQLKKYEKASRSITLPFSNDKYEKLVYDR